MKVVKESITLFASFGFVYVWQSTSLSSYTIQVLGFFIFLFLILAARKRGKNPAEAIGKNSLLSIFLLNTVMELLVFSTGVFNSPLFYLLFFLEFGVAFVFTPTLVFLFVIGICLVFFPYAFHEDASGNLLRLGSLALVSPLAFYFGREFKTDEEQQKELFQIREETNATASHIEEFAQEVLTSDKETLSKKGQQDLEEIVTEAKELQKETT